MEKGNRIIVTDENEIGLIVENAVKRVLSAPRKQDDSFEQERLTKSQAAKFASMSVATIRRRVKQGVFKEHGTGRKTFFIKSELIEALKNQTL